MNLDRLYKIVRLPAALITIGTFLWAGKAMLMGGLRAGVPAWLLVLTAIAAFVSGLFLGKRAKPSVQTVAIAPPKKIHEIRFDYLPDSPVNNGWTLGLEGETQVAPEFMAARDSPIPGSLLIKDRGAYYLDYEVEPHARVADTVEFYVKFTANSVFYLKVRLVSRDKSKADIVWLAHVPGSEPAKEYDSREWTVFVTGDILENGWRRVTLPIAAEVDQTFGRKGWVYQELLGIRFRGTISVSPITFYTSSKQARVPSVP
jgi:hypothetical protein